MGPTVNAMAAEFGQMVNLGRVRGSIGAEPREEVEARFPLPEVFFAAPAGEYGLLLGNRDAVAPRYELERIRSTVLAVPAGVVEASPLEANPDYAAFQAFFDQVDLGGINIGARESIQQIGSMLGVSGGA